MRLFSTRVRSGPVYVVDDDGYTVSLVAEARKHELKDGRGRTILKVLRPSALFVIDDTGVERRALRRVERSAAGLVLSAIGVLFLYWTTLQRGERNAQR